MSLVRIALALVLLGLCPQPARGSGELPRVLIQRAERILSVGNLEAARDIYARVIACCEGTAEAAEAHNDTGVSWARQGLPEKAVPEYERAIAINGYPLAWFNLGRACQALYERTGDDAFRARAVSAYEVFEKLLADKTAQGPLVDLHGRDLEQYLRQSLEVLQR